MNMRGDLTRLIQSLPEDKKAALAAALERDTGVTADKLAAAAADPKTAAMLDKLAGKIDKAALEKLASDPAALSALLRSPQARSAVRRFTGQG